MDLPTRRVVSVSAVMSMMWRREMGILITTKPREAYSQRSVVCNFPPSFQSFFSLFCWFLHQFLSLQHQIYSPQKYLVCSTNNILIWFTGSAIRKGEVGSSDSKGIRETEKYPRDRGETYGVSMVSIIILDTHLWAHSLSKVVTLQTITNFTT